MPKPICDTKKYLLNGPREDNIALLVQISNLPEEIEAEGYKLSAKSYFHVSLVCIGKIIEKYKGKGVNVSEAERELEAVK